MRPTSAGFRFAPGALAGGPADSGLSAESLGLTLDAIRDFSRRHLPESRRRELDEAGALPVELLREMHGRGLGLVLLSVPQAQGGMAASSFDLYRVAETLAGIDLAVATSILASFLGSHLVASAGTAAQRDLWLGRIAEHGLITAFCASEPQAGSDLTALTGRAAPMVGSDGRRGYRLDAAKQWITNGDRADLYLVLARAPAGLSWFVVEAGAPGLRSGPPEAKHGVRASATTAVFLDGVEVDEDRLLGGVEGAGLVQAGEVFSRERLVAAACGLGAGWDALDRALRYARERVVGGVPLARRPGYTHKLLVPPAVALEAGRAFLEETALRHAGGEAGLGPDGALAKYLCTEAGNLAADAAVQALGANGYCREHLVEKIRRDVRVTTIYEGTSEVLEDTVARGRWKDHLRRAGAHYLERAADLESRGDGDPAGAGVAALALRCLAAVMETARRQRLTRHGHLWLRLGELIARVEGAAALTRQAQRHAGDAPPAGSAARLPAAALATAGRICARDAVLRAAEWGKWCGDPAAALPLEAVYRAQAGLVADLDRLAADLVDAGGAGQAPAGAPGPAMRS